MCRKKAYKLSDQEVKHIISEVFDFSPCFLGETLFFCWHYYAIRRWGLADRSIECAVHILLYLDFFGVVLSEL
jgi:hypothetical protein